MTNDYKPEFQTERFDVFRHRVTRNPELVAPRDVYEAWFRDDDIPRSVCEITVWPSTSFGNFIEWVHVCEKHRRNGIATEVMKALEKHLGQLDFEGVTPAGIAFCEAYEKEGVSGA